MGDWLVPKYVEEMCWFQGGEGWLVADEGGDQRGQCILFSVVFTPSPPSHHGSVWALPVISLLLTNTVSPVRAFLII